MTTQMILNVNQNSPYAKHNGRSFDVVREYKAGKLAYCLNVDGTEVDVLQHEVLKSEVEHQVIDTLDISNTTYYKLVRKNGRYYVIGVEDKSLHYGEVAIDDIQVYQFPCTSQQIKDAKQWHWGLKAEHYIKNIYVEKRWELRKRDKKSKFYEPNY